MGATKSVIRKSKVPRKSKGRHWRTFRYLPKICHRSPSSVSAGSFPWPSCIICNVFTAVAQTEVEKMLRCLNTAKASGSDGLPPFLLKHCSACLAPTLTMIINESLATGTVPDILKLANVCPFHKMVIPMTPATTGQSLFCLSYQSFLRKCSTDNWSSTCSTPPTPMVFLTNSFHTDMTPVM